MDYIYASVIRDIFRFKEQVILKECNSLEPHSGDIGLFEVISETGGYEAVEDHTGNLYPLKKGSKFWGCFGNRYSGVNLYGNIPTERISSGEIFDLLALGGIVGNILCPGNLQKDRKTTKVKFLGFAQSRYTGKILNLRDYSLNSKLVEYKNSEPQYIFVFGSSAEVGKTTFVCNLANALKQNYSLSILKICGTGRLKDKMSYIRTEVSPIFDFVDFGLPTTYGICETEYTTVLEKMFNYVKNQSDMIICEIGGDMLEANAPTVLKLIHKLKAKTFFVVNDAMGALFGKSLFGQYSIDPYICSWKQNIYSLKEKINCERVYNIYTRDDVVDMAYRIFKGNN